MERITSILLVLIAVTVSALSQVLLKKSAGKAYSSFIKEYLNVYVISAYSMFALAVVLNSIAMRVLDLSVVATFSESLTFFLAVVTGRVFFGEKISFKKIVGSCFILAGILLTGISII